ADGGATGNDAAADVATIDCATTCTGTTPFCDKSTGKCVACLPQNDTCPATTYCQGANGSYQCAPGCKTASDCAASGDGGAHACC
ncbi:hypothetical protein, partial [Bacillus cereus]|uniref:hypothetical protein n=1 Tax=Bacillus cereus TaxID=1396 RepID=UPI00345C1260